MPSNCTACVVMLIGMKVLSFPEWLHAILAEIFKKNHVPIFASNLFIKLYNSVKLEVQIKLHSFVW